MTVARTLWIAVVTTICCLGIRASARTQRALLALELLALALLSIVALVRVLDGHAGAHAQTPRLEWFSPLVGGHVALAGGVLAALFIFWGWDTTAAVAEETRARDQRAALLSVPGRPAGDPDGRPRPLLTPRAVTPAGRAPTDTWPQRVRSGLRQHPGRRNPGRAPRRIQAAEHTDEHAHEQRADHIPGRHMRSDERLSAQGMGEQV